MQGDGGIKLQYTHCRLCSLEDKSATTAAAECDGSLLTEPLACTLVSELAR
jgi:arginyl-tRNA synthetase